MINSGVNIWTLEDVSEFVCMKKMYAYQLKNISVVTKNFYICISMRSFFQRTPGDPCVIFQADSF